MAVTGGTVGEALAALGDDASAILHRMREALDTRSRLHLFVNGVDLQGPAALDTPVSEGDEVAIIPAIAGGR